MYLCLKGYKHRGMFLATQAPMETTAENFWRMVWENQSHAIVMLCLTKEVEDEREETQVRCISKPRLWVGS